ncbi:MAG TPA: hypothetical protein VGW38_24525 [Chloroflexota bacterium]|nr:hypothetical protein [Chloroflexota bacterium]
MAERTLSEFLQHPNDIMPDLERGPVVLRRRGADDLVVMTREHNGSLETALRVVSTCVTQGTAAAGTTLPWLAFLDARDQAMCLREIALAAGAAMATGRFDLLRDTVYVWQSTGLAAWDYQNRRGNPVYDVEDPVEVARPD